MRGLTPLRPLSDPSETSLTPLRPLGHQIEQICRDSKTDPFWPPSTDPFCLSLSRRRRTKILQFKRRYFAVLKNNFAGLEFV